MTHSVTTILGNAREKDSEQRLFLDIGANLGWFSLLAANLGHRVISVEPMMYNVEIFRASIQNNPDFDLLITLHHCAFSDKIGTACILPSYAGGPQNEGNGQIMPRNGTLPVTGCKETVQLKRMDDVLKDLEERPFLVKIDVEGHEFLALKGGRNVFARLRPCVVIFEYIEQYVLFLKVNPIDLFQYFLRLNYTINNHIDLNRVKATINSDFNYAVNYMDTQCTSLLSDTLTRLSQEK